MKKELALSLVITLFLAMCNIPVVSEPDSQEEYAVYREYRENLCRLQEDTALIYLELHQGKNPHAVYEHMLQIVERTAVLIGNTEAASKDIHNDLRPSPQNFMEMILLLGLNEEQKSNLKNLGCTEEDIAEFMDWILVYNDYNHHVIEGFTPEEMERFYSAGLTDAQVSELQTFIDNYYAHLHTTQEAVKQQQTGLLQVQTSMILAAVKLLEDNVEVKDKSKDSGRLQNAEGKLVEAILDISEDQSSLEHVKAYSKEVYKAAEQNLRKGEHQYLVDFFVGLQIHCGALTALNGDRECGLSQIRVYERVIEECAASPERPDPQPLRFGEQKALAEHPLPLTDFVGLVEESNEANNMGAAVVFVKAPDTTFMQFLMLLFAGVGGPASVNWALPELTISLESLFAGAGVTVSTIATGAVGAVILLLIFIPPVGYGEWPDAIVGRINGNEIIIVVDGSYGQGHIIKEAESGKKPCIRSSHQAIVDDPYKIKEIVIDARKLFYHQGANQYLYYFRTTLKEWVVIIEEWGGYGIYELITAYRLDCKLPEECKDLDGNLIKVLSYLDVLRCQRCVEISIW